MPQGQEVAITSAAPARMVRLNLMLEGSMQSSPPKRIRQVRVPARPKVGALVGKARTWSFRSVMAGVVSGSVQSNESMVWTLPVVETRA